MTVQLPVERLRALRRLRRSAVAGRVLVALFGAGAAWSHAGAAEFVHYPGAWFDEAQTRSQAAVAAERGVASVTVYASNERFDKVDAFYRQSLYPMPPVASGMQRFCLDAVASPQACRRFVELHDISVMSGVGTRITVYQLR